MKERLSHKRKEKALLIHLRVPRFQYKQIQKEMTIVSFTNSTTSRYFCHKRLTLFKRNPPSARILMNSLVIASVSDFRLLCAPSFADFLTLKSRPSKYVRGNKKGQDFLLLPYQLGRMPLLHFLQHFIPSKELTSLAIRMGGRISLRR